MCALYSTNAEFDTNTKFIFKFTQTVFTKD